ncbi:protein screw-like isoform X2 [Eurosta solidaginis]
MLTLAQKEENRVPDDMTQLAELLGLRQASERLKRQPSLRNSATKFLLQVYTEISDDDDVEKLPESIRNLQASRYKRSLINDNFITPFDRREIELCNNIITFASRTAPEAKSKSALTGDMLLNFNLNEIPRDLELQYAAIRLYQNPQLGRYSASSNERNFTINVYQPFGNYLLNVAILNSTTNFHGWLELNVTKLFKNWLHYRTFQHVLYGNELLIGVTLHATLDEEGANIKQQQVTAADVGLVAAHAPSTDLLDLQPFITAYFNGPDLLTKMQRQRRSKQYKRQINAFGYMQQHAGGAFDQPKACERHNFTLDFKYLGMEKSVIAPKTFEAYFCLGECNFPLGTPMNNATNHAIVQTLMHLKRPHLPKPCCVPVKLASISILYSVNEDSVNLMRFSQIVAKECGCR